MKKLILITLTALLGIFDPAMASALSFDPQNFVPYNCTLDTVNYMPLRNFCLDFHSEKKGLVKLAEGAKGRIEYVNNVTYLMAELPLKLRYYDSTETDYRVDTDLQDVLKLPTGLTYSFVLPAGSLLYADEVTATDVPLTNEEIRYEFRVPQYIEFHPAHTELVSSIASASTLEYGWNTETAKGYSLATVELYREDAMLAHVPFNVDWDWQWGQTYVDLESVFGKPINFENGVEYSVRFPKGVVVSTWRDDIGNRAFAHRFTGAYQTDEPIEKLNYVWKSADYQTDEKGYTKVGVVRFGFNREISLGYLPYVYLTVANYDPTKIYICGNVPTLAKEGDEWVLSVNFGNVIVDSALGIKVYIPKGTVVTCDTVLDCNDTEIINLENFSGVENVEVEQGAGQADIYDLQGRKVSRMQPGQIYIQGSKTIMAR